MRKINVVYKGRQALFVDGHPEVLKTDYFCCRPPGYYWSPRYQSRAWDGYTHYLSRGRVPLAMFLNERARIEEEQNIKFIITDKRESCLFVDLHPRYSKALWQHQNEAVAAMVEAAANGGGIVLNATATGKTVLAGAFFARLDGMACFIVDELTLMDQARKELTDVLHENVGIVGDSVFAPERITVATAQTLQIHRKRKDFRKWFRQVDIVILDEVHLALNKRTSQIIAAMRPKAVYGLTATLELEKEHIRMQAMSLCGPVVYEYSLRQGIADNVLAKGVACYISCRQPETKNSSYACSYKRNIVKSRLRNGIIVDICREAALRNYRTILVVGRLAHIAELSKLLSTTKHKVVHGKVPMRKRVEAKIEMEEGKLPLIITNQVFSKGINIKSCNLIVDATAAPSKNTAKQRDGRGRRKHETKLGLLVFDIYDMENRFHAAAMSRRKALEESGIPTIRLKWSDAQSLFDRAEKALRKVVAGDIVMVGSLPIEREKLV